MSALCCLFARTSYRQDTNASFYNSEEFTPEWILKSDKQYTQIHTIASFEFINQNDKKITNKDFEGKIYIADFFLYNLS